MYPCRKISPAAIESQKTGLYAALGESRDRLIQYGGD
jgi:hypothetical protein